MLGTVINIFRIPDLRNKVLFTLALLIIYRIGFHIPVPGFDQEEIADITQSRDTESPLGRAAEYMQMFTGGRWKKAACSAWELCLILPRRLSLCYWVRWFPL